MIVDEVHALAENKRGAHLSITMERLEEVVGRAVLSTPNRQPSTFSLQPSLQRIGLSATVAPLSEAAHFLAGTDRPCEIVDVSTAKKIDLRVYSPLGKNPYPPSGYTGVRLIHDLAQLVKKNRTTLVFTNTRSGAEGATFWLHQALPELAEQIECHHASLDRDVRQEVEDRLKRGELRAVVCSTSLELGIDIGAVDLVVMLSTPKGVSRALQRTGRAGHNIETVSRGLLMATNLNDLVECCATALLARRRALDSIRLPNAPLDVLVQHLASLGAIRRWNKVDALALVRRAYPYRNLSENDFNDALDYLAGGGKALRQQYTELFGKINLDENSFETREGRVRRDLLQNLGVIPSEGMVKVKAKGRTLGMVEETFARQLAPGDVFILAGRPVKLEHMTLMECFVRRADHEAPTVPRWNANKMPLSNRVAEEIVQFRGDLREHLESEEGRAGCPHHAGGGALTHHSSLITWISDRLDCGLPNARIIFKMYAAQHRLSEIPTADFLLIEEYQAKTQEETEALQEPKSRQANLARKRWLSLPPRHYFFHSLIGRAANDALSRVVALRLSRLHGGNAVATPDDYGFVLTVSPAQAFAADDLPSLLTPDRFPEDLDESLSRSDLLKYHFRNAAQTGLMVYRNYFGEQKSVRKLQWSSEVIYNVLRQYEPDHILLREARRDAIHTYLDIDAAMAFLQTVITKPMRLHPVHRVPPLAFAMYATKIKEALMVEDPQETMERLFHLWWEKIETENVSA
jgi:ATP-dependent Lhr-like helicase